MSSELISTLADIEKLVNSFTNIDTYEVLIETIKVQIDLVAENDTTGLYLFAETEQKLKLFYAKGFSPDERNLAESTAMQRHPGYVFKTGEILWVNDQDVENNPFSIDSIKKSHTRSRLYVPVKANNLIIGAFGIQSEKPFAFTEQHLAVLKVFAALAGDAYTLIKKNNLIKLQNEENKKLSYLAKNTPNNVIYADKEGRITWVNEYFENFTGYKLNEIIGKTPGSFLTGPETEPEKTAELRRTIQTKTSCTLTITNYKKNGELYQIAVQLNTIFDEQGEFLYFISIQQDVTQLQYIKRKNAENQKLLQANLQTLKESQTRYSNLLHTTHDLITSLDNTGTILYANNSWLTKMNYSLKEVLGTNIFNYIHPDSQPHCMSFFGEITSGKQSKLDVQYSLISKDGKKIDIDGNVICKIENNTLIEINFFLKDVTEINKNKALEAFKQQEIILYNKTLTDISLINFLVYDNFKSVLQEITNRASACLDVKRISVWSYSGHSIICEDFLDTETKEHSEGSEIFEKDFPKYFHGIKSQLIINASDAHQNEFTQELSATYLTPLNINSMLDIPIKINNKLWGVLCIEHVGDKISWSNEVVSFVKALADIIANISSSFSYRDTVNKLEQVMGSLHETVWGVSLPDYKLEYISKSAVSLYEVPLEDWYDNINLWSDMIHPDDKERIEEESSKLFTKGQINLEYRIITPSNKVKWIFSNTQVIKNAQGIPILMTGISGDITSRKVAENELVNYKTAVDTSSIVSITDVNGVITYVNDKFCEVSKYSRQELIGVTHKIINSNHHSKEFFNDLWQTISSGRIWKGEIKNKAKDGSVYYVESTIIPFMNDGKPIQYISIRHETTQLKLKEEAILNQKYFYENILNNVPIDIAVFDQQHKYIFVNKEAVNDDETRNWLIGKDDSDYAKLKKLPSTFAESRKNNFDKLNDSTPSLIWLDKQNKNGKTNYKERRFFKIINENIIIGVGLDVTDLKKHELLLAESVHEKKTLLGEVHHRVKNNLAVIDGMVELKKSNETDSHLIEILTDIQARVKTVALVHQKLYQSTLFSNVNLGDYVLELIEYHKKILNKAVSDKFKSQVYIKNIYTDISKAVTFGLIFNELLSNSFKYGIINNVLEITISMDIKEDRVYFIYTDSGKGLYTSNTNNKGFGLNLINTLCRQLKAEINYPKESYFKIELDFPIKNIQVAS